MVELAEIQAAYYMVAATGVLIAAIYYIMNLREANKNRRMTMTTSLMQSFISEEGSKRFAELMQMEWRDYGDFTDKYDSSVNPDNFAKRNTFWNTCDILGYQYKQGQLDLGTIWTTCGSAVAQGWVKFGPIILEQRSRGIYNPHRYECFEYLAYVQSRILGETDSQYKVSPIFKSSAVYDAFRAKGSPFELQ